MLSPIGTTESISSKNITFRSSLTGLSGLLLFCYVPATNRRPTIEVSILDAGGLYTGLAGATHPNPCGAEGAVHICN